VKNLLLNNKVKGDNKNAFIARNVLILTIIKMKYESEDTLIFTHLSCLALESHKIYCHYTNSYDKNLYAVYSIIVSEENKEDYSKLNFSL